MKNIIRIIATAVLAVSLTSCGTTSWFKSGSATSVLSSPVVQGALGQLYTLQGTDNPVTEARVTDAISRIVTDSKAAVALGQEAYAKIKAGIDSGKGKTVAINEAISLMLTYLPQLTNLVATSQP